MSVKFITSIYSDLHGTEFGGRTGRLSLLLRDLNKRSLLRDHERGGNICGEVLRENKPTCLTSKSQYGL